MSPKEGQKDIQTERHSKLQKRDTEKEAETSWKLGTFS